MREIISYKIIYIDLQGQIKSCKYSWSLEVFKLTVNTLAHFI